MKHLKKLTAFMVMLAFVLGLTGVLSLRSLANQDPAPDAKAKEVKSALTHGKARGEGAAIKTAGEVNKKGAPKPLPASKGGKARGAEGIVHTDNRTGYYIRLYDTGDYVGTVTPGGDLYWRAQAGTHILLGRVTFPDGSYWTVGPRSTSVDDGETVKWTITD